MAPKRYRIVFIAEKLIYLQLQKTGCTQIASVLAENITGEQIGKHNFLREHISDKKNHRIGKKPVDMEYLAMGIWL